MLSYVTLLITAERDGQMVTTVIQLITALGTAYLPVALLVYYMGQAQFNKVNCIHYGSSYEKLSSAARSVFILTVEIVLIVLYLLRLEVKIE